MSYRDFIDLFGNGMARGPKWEHVESLVMTLVYISIALLKCALYIRMCLKPKDKVTKSKMLLAINPSIHPSICDSSSHDEFGQSKASYSVQTQTNVKLHIIY